jgi:hypothetical protein
VHLKQNDNSVKFSIFSQKERCTNILQIFLLILNSQQEGASLEFSWQPWWDHKKLHGEFSQILGHHFLCGLWQVVVKLYAHLKCN